MGRLAGSITWAGFMGGPIMTRFIAQLNDGSYINTLADEMTKEDNMIYAYNVSKLLADVDISAVIAAHLSENGDLQ